MVSWHQAYTWLGIVKTDVYGQSHNWKCPVGTCQQGISRYDIDQHDEVGGLKCKKFEISDFRVNVSISYKKCSTLRRLMTCAGQSQGWRCPGGKYRQGIRSHETDQHVSYYSASAWTILISALLCDLRTMTLVYRRKKSNINAMSFIKWPFLCIHKCISQLTTCAGQSHGCR